MVWELLHTDRYKERLETLLVFAHDALNKLAVQLHFMSSSHGAIRQYVLRVMNGFLFSHLRKVHRSTLVFEKEKGGGQWDKNMQKCGAIKQETVTLRKGFHESVPSSSTSWGCVCMASLNRSALVVLLKPGIPRASHHQLWLPWYVAGTSELAWGHQVSSCGDIASGCPSRHQE